MKAPVVNPPGVTRLLVLYGSHAHGTATESSDEDWRGVYQAPTDAFLGMDRVDQTWEQKPDIVMWELGHFCRLLCAGNPNIVGLLSAPEDMVADICPVISLLRANRRLFITKRMAYAYTHWMEGELKQIEASTVGLSQTHQPKRLSHVPRLLYELRSAVEGGELVVRPVGKELDYIMAVKTGKIPVFEVGPHARLEIARLRPQLEALPDSPREWVNDILVRARQGEFG